MASRKDLCGDALVSLVRNSFEEVEDQRSRSPKSKISLVDFLMSGFAVFSLKSPSLLAFDSERSKPRFQYNLRSLFEVRQIPSDTRLREVLDTIDYKSLRHGFTEIFRVVQRGKSLDGYKFLDDSYLIALDGTGYFSSNSVHCESCLQKKSRDGKITYSHQLISAVIIHPECKQVLPLCPEPIINSNGSKKNDCERNASKRWLEKFRKDHPKLKVIVTEDGLASNVPHIEFLKKHRCNFILGAKPGDHQFLFEEFELAGSKVQEVCIEKSGINQRFRFLNDVQLNESHTQRVNFLHFEETNKKGKKTTFSWVTDIKISMDNVAEIMRGGRARWKVENETFNTLKNQGYNLEHNYGHGNDNLSVVLAYLMFLAFAVDQVQAIACKVFKKAHEISKSYRNLWQKVRSWFDLSTIPSWEQLYLAIAKDQGFEFSKSS